MCRLLPPKSTRMEQVFDVGQLTRKCQPWPVDSRRRPTRIFARLVARSGLVTLAVLARAFKQRKEWRRSTTGPPGPAGASVVAAVVAVRPDAQASTKVQHSKQEPEMNYNERQRMRD